MSEEYHTFGTIQRRNDDTSPSNEEKNKFLSYLNFFIKSSYEISVMIKTLSFFIERQNDSKVLSNHSPAFMNAVRRCFGECIILKYNLLYDRRDEYSFHKFFDYVSANHDKIFTGIFYNHIIWEDGNEEDDEKITFCWKDVKIAIEESKTLIEQNATTIKKISTLRDKRYAHYDGELITDRISLTDVQNLFQITEKIINKFAYMYEKGHYSLTPTNAGDIENLAVIVKNYEKYRHLIFDEMHRENLENQKNENN